MKFQLRAFAFVFSLTLCGTALRRATRRGLLLALALASFAAPPAFAAPATAAVQQGARCGETAAAAIDEARRALAASDADANRATLSCLIEAVSRMQAQNPVVTRSDGKALAVPITDVVVGQKGGKQ